VKRKIIFSILCQLLRTIHIMYYLMEKEDTQMAFGAGGACCGGTGVGTGIAIVVVIILLLIALGIVF